MSTMENRTLGMTGISIATSLAIESFLNIGEYENRWETPPVQAAEYLLVNVRTLIRNAYNAVDSYSQSTISSKELIEAVEEDLNSIKTHITNANSNCEVGYYVCTYKSINKVFDGVNFRNPTTPTQKLYESVETDVLRYFDKEHEDLQKFDIELKGNQRCVILTHLPLDLLSHDNFPELILLESHTGTLKERKGWGSKLNVTVPKGKVNNLPFNRALLAIFGDRNMIGPQPIKSRKVILKLAEKHKWHPLTTMPKILQDIKLAYEPFLYEFVNKYK